MNSKTRKIRKVKNKKIRNATSVKNVEGIKFRSKLELYTYNKLIENGIKDFDYEKEKFQLMEGFEYPCESIEAFETTVNKTKIKNFSNITNNIRGITYLPDFTKIDHSNKTGWVIECKGYSNDA